MSIKVPYCKKYKGSDENGLYKPFTNHLNWFQKAGPRPAGSSRNREAGQYINDVFIKNGYEVETQEFPCCY